MALLSLAYEALALILFAVIGSGNAWNCGDPSCIVPATASSQPGDASEASVKTAAQCYTACVERYGEFILRDHYVSNGNWYSVPYATIESLDSGCQTLQKVLECQSGCMLKSTDQFLSNNMCRDSCAANCESDCSNVEGDCSYNISGITCRRLCRKTPCKFGCEEFDKITSPDSMPPIAPSQPLEITLVNPSTGDYSIATVAGTPPEDSPPTAFVFKVTKDDEDRFIFKPSLEENLTLGHYACNEVEISYAAVSKKGMSAYSPLLSECIVLESRYPEQVKEETINFTYSEDPRPGHLEAGNAVVNVSWELPVGSEYLSHYTMILVVFGSACGAEMMYFREIPKNVTWYVLEAESPADAPVFHCHYNLILVSMPTEEGDESASIKNMNPVLDVETPKMNYSCKEELSDDNQLLSILFTWSVDEITLLSIKNFKVSLLVGNLGGEDSYEEYNKYTQEIEDGNTTYSHGYNSLPVYEVGSSKQYRVMIVPIKGDLYYWRPIPLPAECDIGAAKPPSPPSQIDKDSIVVSDLFTSAKTHGVLSVSWSQPNHTGGNITEYQLLFGSRPAQDNSSVEQYFVVNVEGNVTSVNLNINDMIPSNTSCDILQIRSRNDFFWSSWSEAVSLLSYTLNCLTISPSTSSSQLASAVPTSTPGNVVSTSMVLTMSAQPTTKESSTASPQTEDALLQYILFGVIALISFLLLITVVCLLVVCIWCLKAKHQRKSVSGELDSVSPKKEGFQLSVSNTGHTTETRKENIYSCSPALGTARPVPQ